MRNAQKDLNAVLTISKQKVKDTIGIADLSRHFSPKMNERTKLPQIICPFHEDENLGSCRIYPDTNTFKCEACGAQGDMLKLASGYLNISTNNMNELLERLVSEFRIPRSNVLSDYNPQSQRPTPPPDRLSPEEYTYLLQSDHYSVPTKFEQIEHEEGKWDYVPSNSTAIYYRTLVVKDPEFHDWVICTISRKYWLRYMEMLLSCQNNGYVLMEDVVMEHLEKSNQLLRKGLVNKKVFAPELRLRNRLLNELLDKSTA